MINILVLFSLSDRVNILTQHSSLVTMQISVSFVVSFQRYGWFVYYVQSICYNFPSRAMVLIWDFCEPDLFNLVMSGRTGVWPEAGVSTPFQCKH